jgi:hypothetical protein
VINSVSKNYFGGYVSSGSPFTSVDDDSEILTIILDIIYRNPNVAVNFAPPFAFDKLATAIGRLSVFGVDFRTQSISLPTVNTNAPRPIFSALLAHASTNPLELYILAAQHNLESLAVAASTYLVGFHIADLDDEQTEAMCPRYLRRLILMQTRRENPPSTTIPPSFNV